MIGRLSIWLSAKTSVGKVMSSIVGALIAYFAPVATLILVMLEFIAVDFIIGIWASRCRAKRDGQQWFFSSKKMWRTVYKLCFSIVSVVFSYHLDFLVLSFVDLHLPQIVCGFICGAELWSFLEDAACISDHPVFRWLQKYAGSKLKQETGFDPEKLNDNQDK